MSVAYTFTSKTTTPEALTNDQELRESLESPSNRAVSSSETARSSRPATRNSSTRKAALKRTSQASDPLFSMDGFAVSDGVEFRQLMLESLREFAVAMEGTGCRKFARRRRPEALWEEEIPRPGS